MKSFLNQLDHDRIVSAIAEAEKKTSGEIRVHLHHKRVEDAVVSGTAVFEKLGMTASALRNGVLIFVAPRSRKFAILGDSGVHEKCGDGFWREAAARMEQHFREGRFTDAIVEGIAASGEILAAHFPGQTQAPNALPDEIDETN